MHKRSRWSGKLLQHTITNSIGSGNLKLEIICVLNCVLKGYSSNSSCGLNDIFKVMFSDSKTAKTFSRNQLKLGA